jgi:hypothetical protein
MVRSIRLSGSVALIFVVSHASGCGNAVDVNWPAGTEAIVQDRGAQRVLAEVPIDQRETVGRRRVAITNKTPVIIVDDYPAYRVLSSGSANSMLPQSPVRVRVTEGADQGVELIIRRQDLAPRPEPDQLWLAYVPVFSLFFIATAATLSIIETLASAMRNRRKFTRHRLANHSSARIGPQGLTRKRKSWIPERGDNECDQWFDWVAALNTRKKVRCATSCRSSSATDR